MGWLLRKVDMLSGAVIAGGAGAGASQLQAFMVQYLQRLGGHLDEARRTFDAIGLGERYRQRDGATRELITGDALARVNELRTAHDAILEGDLISRPFVFFRHLDIDIAGRTWENFTPALPFDTAGLVYAGTGLVLGLILYELAKGLVAIPFRRRRHERTGAQPASDPKAR